MNDSRHGTPRHMGIIMDGNGRWAQQRGLERTQGHMRGIDVVRRITEHASKRGIEYLTLYAFSTENWQRPEPEVQFLNRALLRYLESEQDALMRNDIRLEAMGRLQMFAPEVRDQLERTRAATAANRGMCLVLAVSYGGLAELGDALQRIAADLLAGRIGAEDIDDDSLMRYSYLPEIGPCDCILRTSGEQRLSNFLTLQSAYSELIFTPTLWPDFTPDEFDAILDEYGTRQRRFGQ